MQTTLQVNPKVLRAMRHVMAKKDIRYYLNGACVQVRADAMYYIATDGHHMAVLREPWGEDHEPAPNAEYIIPGDAIKALKPHKTMVYCTLTVDGEKENRRAVFSGLAGPDVGCEVIDARFPDWQRVTPKDKPSGEVAQYNPDLLSNMQACYREIQGNDRAFLTLHYNGNSGAALSGGDSRFVGVVMPMRDAGGDLPEWLNPNQELAKAA